MLDLVGGNYIPLEARKKYKVTLHNFPCCFETSTNLSNQLKAYHKALWYCKKGSGKSGRYHQHMLTAAARFETFISLDVLASPMLKPASAGTGCLFVFKMSLLIGFKKSLGHLHTGQRCKK